jgi:hypothetical protein
MKNEDKLPRLNSNKEIDKFRAHNNELLPKWYKWELHLLFNLVTFALFLSFGFVRIDLNSQVIALKLILSFLLWGIIEYAIHRFVLHGKFLNSLPFYKDHSVYHHGYFTHQDMHMSTMHDLNRVLLRPIDIFAVLGLNLFISALLSFVVGMEWATYIYLSGVVYLFVYELFHFMTHYYKGNGDFWLGIQRHHQSHHEKKLMKEINFSVVFPFMDRIFGTVNKNKNELRKL